MTDSSMTLSEAIDAELRRVAGPRTETATRVSDLLRTGQALVTIRNRDGLHLVYRLRVRGAWTGRDGVERPGSGYWIDCRSGDWTAVGIVAGDGSIRATANSTSDRAILYGAQLVVEALRRGARTIDARGRLYTLHVEDRCGRCGSELTDPISIERGFGPTCFGKETGSKTAR